MTFSSWMKKILHLSPEEPDPPPMNWPDFRDWLRTCDQEDLYEQVLWATEGTTHIADGMRAFGLIQLEILRRVSEITK